MLMWQGLEPEARTFNTIIIACNMCGQPQEALRVGAIFHIKKQGLHVFLLSKTCTPKRHIRKTLLIF